MSDPTPKGPALSATAETVFQAIQAREEALQKIDETAQRWARHRLELLLIEIEDTAPDDKIILLVQKEEQQSSLEYNKLRALQLLLGVAFRFGEGTPLLLLGRNRYSVTIEWSALKKAFEYAAEAQNRQTTSSTPSS